MTQCSSKHEKWAISSSCSSHSLQYKSTLTSSKGLVYIVFRLSYGSPTSHKDLASFWGQIPLHMAKNFPKRPNLDKNYNKITILISKIKLGPQGQVRAPFSGSYESIWPSANPQGCYAMASPPLSPNHMALTMEPRDRSDG
jgi:hypothetical protein